MQWLLYFQLATRKKKNAYTEKRTIRELTEFKTMIIHIKYYEIIIQRILFEAWLRINLKLPQCLIFLFLFLYIASVI